ncbi:hypothetical protein ACHAXT_009221 [Thalassiosira profunda]
MIRAENSDEIEAEGARDGGRRTINARAGASLRPPLAAMDAANDPDEERGDAAAANGGGESSSSAAESEGHDIYQYDSAPPLGIGQPPFASAPDSPVASRGGLSSFLARFQKSADVAANPHGSTVTAGKWRSLAGSRKIKLASQRSDVGGDEVRGIVATPLEMGQGRPMAPGARFLRNVQAEVEVPAPPQFLRMKSSANLQEDEEGWEEEDVAENQMYRLQATRGSMDVGCFRRTIGFCCACVNCGALTESATEQNLYLGVGDPNRWLMFFFFWLFRKGWATVIILSVTWYYALVLLFALLIVWSSELDNDCVKVGGVNIGDLGRRTKFMDAFSLSWNTFSTVGYGSTYPALSTDPNNHGGDHRCAFIAFLTSFEAFVGVLFAGFVGAIFFAKVSRISQRADVRFSDCLTVRFGSGVDVHAVDDENEQVTQSALNSRRAKEEQQAEAAAENASPLQKFRKLAKKAAKPSPFPVITFRIANEMHNTPSGEIIGASVKAVVLMESTRYEDQVSDDLAKQVNEDRNRRESKEAKTPAKLRASLHNRMSLRSNLTNGTDRTNETISGDRSSDHSDQSRKSSLEGTENAMTYLQGLNALAYKTRYGGSKKMKIDEEEGGVGSTIVPRMVFTNLKLETSEHPLFKRIWRFKHVIDAESPLLTPEAQKAILDNNGTWPWHWNHHEAVRRAIRFNQMVVSFTGISNISGASVYKQRVYDYVDTVVGYQFVNALYRGRRGNLKVDLTLINDVAEQNGGGGEPLNVAINSP